MGEFEKTVLRLVAESDIRNLVARICHLADMEADLGKYLDCFTEDAVWEFTGSAGKIPEKLNAPHLSTKIVGREALAADRQHVRDGGFQGPGTKNWHVNTTLSVKVNDDGTADAESYWLNFDTNEVPVLNAMTFTMGYYHDTFRHTDQGWKLSHRRFVTGGAWIKKPSDAQ
jgi:hypothetical protein